MRKPSPRIAIARGVAAAHGPLRSIVLPCHSRSGVTRPDVRLVAPVERSGAALAFALLAAGRSADALPHAARAIRVLEQLGRVVEGESLIRLAHVEALFAIGDESAALGALSAAFGRVHERAGRITDLAWRAGFLESVPENARILMLSRRHGVVVGGRIHRRAISLRGIGVARVS